MSREEGGQSASRDVHRVAEEYAGSTVLITGGRGYIGAALAQRLAAVDCELVLWDRSAEGTWQPVGAKGPVRLLQGDVCQAKMWKEALPNTDYVFHLAAFEHRQGSEHDAIRDLQVNAMSVLHLVETCRQESFAPYIVFASSANIFGCASSPPVNEDAPDDPLTLFAIHKLAAEQYLRLIAVEHGMRSTALRLANVYGPTARAERMEQVVLNKLIARALAGRSLSLYANRDCVRDYVFIDDVIDAFLLAGLFDGDSSERRFVIGSEQGHTIGDVVRLVAEVVDRRTGGETEILSDLSMPIGPAERRNFVADAARFRGATGWTPRIDLKQGIETTVEAMA